MATVVADATATTSGSLPDRDTGEPAAVSPNPLFGENPGPHTPTTSPRRIRPPSPRPAVSPLHSLHSPHSRPVVLSTSKGRPRADPVGTSRRPCDRQAPRTAEARFPSDPCPRWPRPKQVRCPRFLSPDFHRPGVRHAGRRAVSSRYSVTPLANLVLSEYSDTLNNHGRAPSATNECVCRAHVLPESVAAPPPRAERMDRKNGIELASSSLARRPRL